MGITKNWDQPTFHTVLDSGVPSGSTDYTTVVLIHGLGWKADVFRRLLPLASTHNSRVIAFNRRDYPGSKPYTDEERATLARLANAPVELEGFATEAQDFAVERAREIYGYLSDLVTREVLPRASSRNSGGIVLVGWSLGALWATGFLAHAPWISREARVDLSGYVRRVIAYDAIALFLGYDIPQNTYRPLTDPDIPPEERGERFNEWVTSYWAHGEHPGRGTCSASQGLSYPPPTFKDMSKEQISALTHERAGESDSSDVLTMQMYGRYGLFGRLKDKAFYLGMGHDAAHRWDDVEARVVWCDHSHWPSVWTARTVAAELGEALVSWRRRISLVRLRGANHFAHWDIPKETLGTFLSEEALKTEEYEAESVSERAHL